ncbi:MAG: valine--tRNA ligase [Alphaproteobacteria bacterium]|nr:valine--tRNA ligase [Alphaproteobacteria bacterium]
MLEKSFIASESEKEIKEQWEENNLFSSRVDPSKPMFSIVIPPPNVTGNLHMGHALNNSIQDTLVRYKRMRGYSVLWQPGMDHAGIATQMVVERELAKKGLTKHDLGREEFIKTVWEWKKQSGGQILNQLKHLGASADWSRERFTMDEGLSCAVRKVFVQLYKEGLIYRDKKLVNWDSRLQTAISDLEVEQKETVGKMYYLKYPLETENSKYILVATTRPETMFGDTAVAVSAEDERYKDLIGKNVILPIVNRPIPVVADEHADPEKGSGVVKITPAHDFNDFEVGKRHHLPVLNILDKDAKLNENTPEKYQGLSVLEARKLVLEEMKLLGLYEKEEDNLMSIPYGDRSGVVIEPWLTDQWFVDAKKLAVDAIRVIKNEEIRFIPKNWENTYYEWMENIQPWCISRQLWWGHQIPVWYGPDNTIFCEETFEEAFKKAEQHYGKKVDLRRDNDVLDTWFSSSLWPFTTLGWPNDDEYLKYYYPTSVLITAFDIIFFWIARMIMMAMHIKKEIPFKEIYIHGLVRDEKGQKMSKSKGNGIDPLVISEKYGTDALRFSLLVQAGSGRNILMSEERVANYRNFVTKIWNSVRFAEMNGADFNVENLSTHIELPVNKWILTKLSQTICKTQDYLDTYLFNEASKAIYQFIWGNFCDWYLEAVKPLIYGEDEQVKTEIRHVMGFVINNTLRLIQPFMPFVSEDLWRKTAVRSSMLMQTDWPELTAFEDSQTESEVDWVFNFISSIRSLRSEINIPASAKIQLKIKGITPSQKEILTKNEIILKFLARVDDIEFVQDVISDAIMQVFDGFTFILPFAGLIDIKAEKDRINKDIDKLSSFIKQVKAELNNQKFILKALPSVVEGKRESLAEAETSISKMYDILKKLSS